MAQYFTIIKAAKLLLLFQLFFGSILFAQTAISPTVGDGTKANPYEISTLENLYWISDSISRWDKHYIQTANINASATKGWNSGAGFNPIGPSSSENFSGSYNGQGYTIDSLFMFRPDSSRPTALFGYTANAEIKNLGLTNVDITGSIRTAALIGYAYDGNSSKAYGGTIISNCYSTGVVKGTQTIGGLVAYNTDGKILSCYSTAKIYATDDAGGLVGNNRSSIIENSYSTGTVTRLLGINTNFGSLVGRTSSPFDKFSVINFSYATGAVIYEGEINPTNNGFIGLNYGKAEFNYFDSELSLQISGVGASPKSSTEMKTQSTFVNWDFTNIWSIDALENNGYPKLRMKGLPLVSTSNISKIGAKSVSCGGDVLSDNGSEVTARGVVWSTSEYPTITSNLGITTDGGSTGEFNSTITGLTASTTYYARAYATNGNGTEYGLQVMFMSHSTDAVQPLGEGTIASPYQIQTLENLYWIQFNPTQWDKHYIQTAHINAGSTKKWFDGTGWIPIGYNWENSFTGNYDGKGFKIDSIYINNSDADYKGLFGFIKKATISNLAITNIYINTTKSNVGALAGYVNDNSNISKVYATGSVKGLNYVGGVAGFFVYENNINECYSNVSVIGNSRVGGLIGEASSNNTINNCYSMGDVHTTNISSVNVGGLVGELSQGGVITNSYSKSKVTRQTNLVTANGFVGVASIGGTFTSNYFDKETSLQDTTAANTAISMLSEQMKEKTNYINWDFSNIWSIDPIINDGYPYLEINTNSIKNNMVESATGLLQNYPNPFKTSTEIKFFNEQYGLVHLVIYDANGRMIQTLYRGYLTSGVHTFYFDGVSLDNGMYMCKAVTTFGGYTCKMFLIK